MEDLNALYNAFLKADAAGDTAAAQTLASYIRQVEAQRQAPVAAPPKSAGFSLKDTALSAAQGVVGAGKSLTDIFGADNVVSEKLGEAQKGLGSLITPERQAEQQRRQATIKAAGETGGTLAEIKAELGGIAEAPLQSTASALGSIVPYAITGAVGAAYKLLPITIRAINTVVGTIQGVGAVKGSIYEAVKEELSKTLPEDQAKEQARLAQETLGKNLPSMIGGGALGGLGARTGVENLLQRGAGEKLGEKLLPRVGKAALAEAPLEGAQGGQEQLAQNLALQKVGADVPTFRGVAGRTAGDAALGALAAGTVGAVRGPTPVAPPKPAPAPVAEAPVAPPAAPPEAPKYEDLYMEREQLRAGPRNRETNAQIAALSAQLKAMDLELAQGAVAPAKQAEDEEAISKKLGYPAKQSAETFAKTEPTQVEMREAIAEEPARPDLDLFGRPVQAPAPRTEGLADVVAADLPASTDVLQAAGIAPTTKELEAAGQQRLDLPEGFAYPQTPLPIAKAGAEQPAKPAAKPTPPATGQQPITARDVSQFGSMSITNRQWLIDNVEGRTPDEVRDMVAADPAVYTRVPGAAKALREIVANATPKEAPSVQPTSTAPSAGKPPVVSGGNKPSVAVPVQPAGTEPVGTAAGKPTPAAKPSGPVGSGLVPAGQPAVAGAPSQEPIVAPLAPAPAPVAKAAPAPAPVAKAAPAPAPVTAKPAKPASPFGALLTETEGKPDLAEPAPAPKPASERVFAGFESPQAILAKATAAAEAAEAAAEKAEKQAAIVTRQTKQKAAAPAPAPAKPAEKAEQTKDADKLLDRIYDLGLDPETTKAKVRAEAQKAVKAGLIDEGDLSEINNIGKDRDMGPEDMLDAFRSAAENRPTPPTEKPAKKAEAPAKPAKESKGRKSTAVVAGQSLESLKKDIAAGKGFLYAALRRAIASGKVILEEKHPDGGVGGYFDGFRVTLYADGIPAGDTIAVALHEVAAHLGFKNLFGQRVYDNIIKRIQDLAMSKTPSLDRAMAQATLQRIPEADIARGAEVYGDETIAYFIEEAAKADAAGKLPKEGPVRAIFNNIRLAMLAAINRVFGSKLGVDSLTTSDILAMAGGAFIRESFTQVKPASAAEIKRNFSVSYSVTDLIDGAGPLTPVEKRGLPKMIEGFKATPNVDYTTRFRTRVADLAATVESRFRDQFDGAVRNSLGELNPMGLFRQAQDYTKLLLSFFQTGSLVKDATTGLWSVKKTAGIKPPADVFPKLEAWGKSNGMDMEQATKVASRILEGVRLDAMRKANKLGAGLQIHQINKNSNLSEDQQIDMMVAEYQRHPELKEIVNIMNEARKGLVDNMVAVGRLSKEQGDMWRDIAGYVPFDRITDKMIEDLSKSKFRVGSPGLAQLGKLPELKGSIQHPVGNVFNNYLNTMGWMVGQIMKTDATVTTLRALEKTGHAEFLGRSPQGRENAVGMYTNGELSFWALQSKYDVMAFMDTNGVKPAWILNLGAFSNVLRKAITALPPFALKQVTDDVQRAIMTSGVKNPGALLRMALTNFASMSKAELSGIEHPAVRDFGALGLTGEYDFNAGKPAESLLKDLGYAKRSRFETILHRLDGVTRASDLAVRKAIFDQTMKESNNDLLLAQTRAREFINFRRRGSSEFVGNIITMVPFYNAYIQGMDVLYRAASGKESGSSVNRAQARKMFWSRAAIVVAMSSLYALGKDDDDQDYKDMDLRTRDNNWIIGNVKLPVPGELGVLFKVIPERVVEYLRRSGSPEEQDALEAVRTALTTIVGSYFGRVVPVPQAVKPLLEIWGNRSFLTGNPLEGFHQRNMDPSQRVASNTSEMAKAIATFSRDVVGAEVSPIAIDTVLNGYLASTAGILTAITDSLLNPDRVDRPLHKWALLSNYLYDPVGNRQMTEFYEERDRMGRAKATLSDLMKTDMDRAVVYAEEHADELVFEKSVNATLNHLEKTRAYRTFLNSPDGAKSMDRADREEQLKEIKLIEKDLVGWLREAKAAYAKR